jgi:hypothetical protein
LARRVSTAGIQPRMDAADVAMPLTTSSPASQPYLRHTAAPTVAALQVAAGILPAEAVPAGAGVGYL